MDIPLDLIIEIIKCDWMVYIKMKSCNKELHSICAKMDPYALFTRKIVEDYNEIGTVTYWRTSDGVNIRSIRLIICGFTKVKLRDKRHQIYNYGSIPFIDDQGNFQTGEFKYTIKTYDVNGIAVVESVSNPEWHLRRQKWIDLVKD